MLHLLLQNALCELLGAFCLICHVRPVAEIAVVDFAFFPVQCCAEFVRPIGGVAVLLLIGAKNIVHNCVLFPAVGITRGLSAGDSPRLKWSERGSPPGQGGAPEAETTKQPAVGGLLEDTDLEREGCSLH